MCAWYPRGGGAEGRWGEWRARVRQLTPGRAAFSLVTHRYLMRVTEDGTGRPGRSPEGRGVDPVPDCQLPTADQAWHKHVMVLDSIALESFIEFVWCVGTYEILSNRANCTSWSSLLALLHQARTIKHRKVFYPGLAATQSDFRGILNAYGSMTT